MVVRVVASADEAAGTATGDGRCGQCLGIVEAVETVVVGAPRRSHQAGPGSDAEVGRLGHLTAPDGREVASRRGGRKEDGTYHLKHKMALLPRLTADTTVQQRRTWSLDGSGKHGNGGTARRGLATQLGPAAQRGRAARERPRGGWECKAAALAQPPRSTANTAARRRRTWPLNDGLKSSDSGGEQAVSKRRR